MVEERYPGERRGLTRFLSELEPVVALEMGEASLLLHAIRAALRTGSLARLRHARALFNHLPREVRRDLSEALLHQPPTVPERRTLLAEYARRPATAVIAFESGERDRSTPRPSLRHELGHSAEIRVLLRPGTLPAAAAERLRRIADVIEKNRRMLSSRYWRQRELAFEDDADSREADCR